MCATADTEGKILIIADARHLATLLSSAWAWAWERREPGREREREGGKEGEKREDGCKGEEQPMTKAGERPTLELERPTTKQSCD